MKDPEKHESDINNRCLQSIALIESITVELLMQVAIELYFASYGTQ